MPEEKALAALIEAVLAVAGEAVLLDGLVAAAGDGIGREAVEEAIEIVRQRHEQAGSGLFLERVAGGVRLATRPEHELSLIHI